MILKPLIKEGLPAEHIMPHTRVSDIKKAPPITSGELTYFEPSG